MSDNVKSVIALTGATGFLGSHLLATMLSKGYEVVVFGRSSKEEALQRRIYRLLRWFGLESLVNKVSCVETDLSLFNLGIGNEEYTRLCALIDSVVHCASDTSFAESKREKVIAANIENLKGILEFSKDANIRTFHYISTAYVAGICDTVCKEVLSVTSSFTNVYEESKAAAETIISHFCKENSILLSIIRPSIVYGDSQTGRSLKFNALYFPIRSVQSIKDIYLNDLLNNGGTKSSKHGIHLDEEGYLFIPLKIYLPHRGTINLIPVDYFVSATLKIIENCSHDGIYHLTTSSAPSFDFLSLYTQELLKVRGVEIAYGKPEANINRNPAEELFDRFIEPYRPYLSDNRNFDRTNSDLITGGMAPPEFTYDIFTKCMEYAIGVKWGALTFE